MKKIVGIVGVILLVIIDQITKYFAITKLMNKDDFIIIKDVLCFHYLQNTGAAWGMFSNGTLFFAIITVIMIILILFVYIKMPSNKRMLPLNIVAVVLMAGAIGNLIDRVFRKYVVDFIYFELIDFPVFNVADCYVTIAGIAMGILVLFVYKENDFEFMKKK